MDIGAIRLCDGCTACCTIGAVPEIGKPPRTPCQYLMGKSGGCSIYEDPMRPKVCHSFHCEWIKGAGELEDQPHKSGVMVTINDLNGGYFVFVMELWKDAARTTGARVIMDVASRVERPVIVVNFDSRPPTDFGDYTVVKQSLKEKAKRMMGAPLGFLDTDREYGIYELVNI